MPAATRLARKLVATAFLLMGLQPALACNAVLGIEQARHDETFGAKECPPRKVPPKTDCTPCPDGCQGQCKVAECLGNHECRSALWEYRYCLGGRCDDPLGECLGCVSDNSQALEVVKCLTKCPCSAGAPTSMCEMYCSCMAAQCGSNLPDGSMEGCLTACALGASPAWQSTHLDTTVAFSWSQPMETWRSYCLWEHCELAALPQNVHHCGHAIGKFGWCEKEPAQDVSGLDDCPPRTNGFNGACNVDADCCSNQCDTTTGACTRP